MDNTFCQICNVPLTGPAPAKQHYSSEKHMKRARNNVQSNALTPPRSSNNGRFVRSDTFCSICSVPLSGPAPAQQHYSSEKHLKKERALSQDSSYGSSGQTGFQTTPPGPSWFICDVCGKSCNTKEMLDIHKQSPKCKKMAGLGQNVMMIGDRTVWHECRYCKKKLNSAPQLETHMKSCKRGQHVIPPSTPPNYGAPVVSKQSVPMRPQPRQEAPQLHDFWKQIRPAISPTGTNRPNPDVMAPQPSFTCLSGDSVSFSGPPSDSTSMPFQRSMIGNEAPGPELNMTDSFKASMLSLKEDGGEIRASDSTGWRNADQYNAQQNFPPSPPVPDRGQLILREDQPQQIENLTDQMVSLRIASPPKKQGVASVSLLGSSLDTMNSSGSSTLASSLDNLDRLIDEGIRTDTCEIHQCKWHCPICNSHNQGGYNKQQHLGGSKHKKMLEKHIASMKRGPQEDTTNTADNPFPNFQFYCRLCNVPFNSECSIRSHNQGKQHLTALAKSEKVPERPMRPLNKHQAKELCWEKGYELTENIPRSYQLELYVKAMQDDTVVFLPTG